VDGLEKRYTTPNKAKVDIAPTIGNNLVIKHYMWCWTVFIERQTSQRGEMPQVPRISPDAATTQSRVHPLAPRGPSGSGGFYSSFSSAIHKPPAVLRILPPVPRPPQHPFVSRLHAPRLSVSEDEECRCTFICRWSMTATLHMLPAFTNFNPLATEPLPRPLQP